jgi:hypothetical protein
MGSWALLIAIATALLTGGCVLTLLAQNYYTTEELLECEALVRAVEHEHAVPSSRHWVGTAIACGHEHYGFFATRYATVSVWWIVERRIQDGILLTLRDERSKLPKPHPIIVRFYDAENWALHRDVNGEIYGEGRGPEKLLRKAFVK